MSVADIGKSRFARSKLTGAGVRHTKGIDRNQTSEEHRSLFDAACHREGKTSLFLARASKIACAALNGRCLLSTSERGIQAAFPAMSL